ncbi:MAG: hypothetical protein JW844_00090 [Candidatus Omnitrophica bacterium]|nr:hypothetical protein [Candidatus Omnitrophota bacterium]
MYHALVSTGKKILLCCVFYAGWVLSPFTWWNDTFVNIPLSYFLANILYPLIPFSFSWLVIGAYWCTNILGLCFLYFGGRGIIRTSSDRIAPVVGITVFLILYTMLALYLDSRGVLLPLGTYFKDYCRMPQQ